MKILRFMLLFAVVILVVSCSKSSTSGGEDPVKPQQPPVEKYPVKLSLGLSTRATESAFESGDQIGVYMVNYNGNSPGALANSGNYMTNVKFTFNGTWAPSSTWYWIDHSTHADFYVYYPYGSPANIAEYSFSVQTDQSSDTLYKKSDFIWGKKGNVAPTSGNVSIQTSHIMSCAVIKVVAGNGITEEELSAQNLKVLINNIKNGSSINLSNGDIQATGDMSSITPLKTNGEYKAIIVPQEVAECNLITLLLNEDEYLFKQGITFQKGKKHTITITLNKDSEGLKVGISDWEDDGTDNGGTAQ